MVGFLLGGSVDSRIHSEWVRGDTLLPARLRVGGALGRETFGGKDDVAYNYGWRCTLYTLGPFEDGTGGSFSYE